ncbi:hypothetical protein KBY25_00770 [Ruegeria pomeroyi]|nr:hypothetical protein [Ruegeria pomeroyi]MCE8544345.1 hypothetical protein [Ruegeria pomeroyi]
MNSCGVYESPVNATKPGLRAWFFRWISIIDRKRERERAVLEADLIRLAETAPHLLADIGFAVDPLRSNTATTVWVSPDNDLAFEQPGPAAITRAG